MVTITKENNRLMAKAEGQSKVGLIPESEIDFFIPEIDAHITFRLDNVGNV